jgi:hypothetical protein
MNMKSIFLMACLVGTGVFVNVNGGVTVATVKDASLQKLEATELMFDGGSIRFRFASKNRENIYLLAKNRVFQKGDQKIYISLEDRFKAGREILPGSDDEKIILKELSGCQVSLEKMRGDLVLLRELIGDRTRPWPDTSRWSFYDREGAAEFFREIYFRKGAIYNLP